MKTFYITYTNDFGNKVKHENISEQEWRFIRAICDANGWTINWDETSKKV